MLRLKYECHTARDCAATVICVRQFFARGDTPAEVQADAERQRRAMDGWNLTAVGLHNTRADWEAVCGPSDLPDTAFGDPPAATLFQKIKAALTGR